MTISRAEVISSVERRRRWSQDEKERLVAASLEPGASVSEVARIAGLHVSQLFRWRKELCKHGEASMAPFVPVEIGSSVPPREVAEAPLTTTAARRRQSHGIIEIDLGSGHRIRFDGDVDGDALTPGAVREYVAAGHSVVVETNDGAGIGATDDNYRKAGATIVGSAREVFASTEMIVKVKEPQPSEWAQLLENQILFTYLHLAPDPEQAKGLLNSGCTAIAYETVTDANGGLPLLAPMSDRQTCDRGSRDGPEALYREVC